MFTDLYGYSFKAEMWTRALAQMDKTLPSYREAKLHLANLERLIRRFEREVPVELLDTMPVKQLRKKRGQYKQRVAQQDKRVDKSLRALIEESALRELQLDGQKYKRLVRGHVQKRVADLNRQMNQIAKKTLRLQYRAVARVLSGK